MTNILCQYVAALDLQQLFRDKDTGLPLSAGQVYFWEDSARTIPKAVYKFAGTPTVPAFEALPNPVILNLVGAFDDAIYYFPYDENGNIQLYYIQVFSAEQTPSDIPQLTRESWPPGICGTGSQNIVAQSINYIANPQFRMHLDIPESGEIPERQVTLPLTNLAPGAWQFQVDDDFTSKNIIIFEGFTETIDDPPGNPPFFFRLQCQNPTAGEIYKDLNCVFRDVNFLAGKTVTLQFEGQSNIGDTNVEFVIKRNYGPAGSPPDEVIAVNFTLTNTLAIKTLTFTLGDNDGKIIDPDVNTTSITFSLRYPTNVLSDTKVTNFFLAEGEFTQVLFPSYSVNQDVSLSLGGSLPVPAPDGSDNDASVVLNYVINPDIDGEAGLKFGVVPGNSSKNIIIGGAFTTNPWQRGTGITVSQGEYMYLADRFAFNSPSDGNMVVGMVRNNSGSNLPLSNVYSQNALSITSQSISAGSTSDTASIQHPIEGYDFVSIAQQYSVLSFNVIADIVGRYSITIFSNDRHWGITLPYMIDKEDEGQHIELIIPPSPSDGPWNYSNGLGILVNWELSIPPFPVSPSDEGVWILQGSDGIWGISDQVNLFAATDINLQIDQVQLQPGKIATRFWEPPFPTLLQKCQRFYEKSYPLDMRPGTQTDLTSGVGGYANLVANTNRSRMVVYYSAHKRIAGDTTTNFIWSYDGTQGQATSGGGDVSPDTDGFFGQSSASYGEFIVNAATVYAHFTADAEFYF